MTVALVTMASLAILVAVSAYFFLSPLVPTQGEHLTVSLQLQLYNSLPSSSLAVPLDLLVNVTNTGTQNVTISQISILGNSLIPVYNESCDYPLGTGSEVTFYLVLSNYPQSCTARVLTSDGSTFDSNSLDN
jgi:hypothetical protein